MTSSKTYRDTCPHLICPDDFDVFWNAALDEVSELMVSYEILSQEQMDDLTLTWLTFRSLDGAVLTGYLLRWNDPAPRPLVVYTHGYMGQSEVMHDWAAQGVNVFGYDIRGMGRSIDALADVSPYGYILTGINEPQTHIMRAVVCDYLQAVRVAKQLLDTSVASTVFYGYSFGGAIATMAAALKDQVDYLVVGVPTLGWAEGRRLLVRAGSGMEINRYIDTYPELELQVMRTLNYCDTVHFASRVQCPTMIGLGEFDEVVPVETVYAIVNHLNGPHVVRECPYSHSDHPAEALWKKFEEEWLDIVCANKSLPDQQLLVCSE